MLLAERTTPHHRGVTGRPEIEVDGEVYLSVERAAEEIGRSRASMFAYIRRYQIERHRFPLEGKRTYVRRADLAQLDVPYAKSEPPASTGETSG